MDPNRKLHLKVNQMKRIRFITSMTSELVWDVINAIKLNLFRWIYRSFRFRIDRNPIDSQSFDKTRCQRMGFGCIEKMVDSLWIGEVNCWRKHFIDEFFVSVWNQHLSIWTANYSVDCIKWKNRPMLLITKFFIIIFDKIRNYIWVMNWNLISNWKIFFNRLLNRIKWHFICEKRPKIFLCLHYRIDSFLQYLKSLFVSFEGRETHTQENEQRGIFPIYSIATVRFCQ